MDNRTIKENITVMRKLRGYSQHEMARRTGISHTHYRSLESGETLLINPNLTKIAEILDVGIGFLLLGEWNSRENDFMLEEDAMGYGFGARCMGKATMRYKDMQSGYESQIEHLRIENESLRQTLESQKRDIEHLESFVRMLSKLKGLDDTGRDLD